MSAEILSVYPFASLVLLGARIEPCGSRVTCSPPPADTDHDFLVELPPDEMTVSNFVCSASEAGFRWEGNEHYQTAVSTFMSWRRDDINLIVTSDATFAARHRVATSLCKRLNLLAKDDRIAVFQAVLYGNEWTGHGNAPTSPFAREEEEIAF